MQQKETNIAFYHTSEIIHVWQRSTILFLVKKRNSGENLWADEDFKNLKKKKLEATLEEQQVRIQLMKNQSQLFLAQAELVKAQTDLVKLQAHESRRRIESFESEFLYEQVVTVES